VPYLTAVRKKSLLNPTFHPTHKGDWNYLYTLAFISMWKNDNSYTTIHKIALSVLQPELFEETNEVTKRIAESMGASKFDLVVARQLAFREFMRRVGDRYEDKKREENGDVYSDFVSNSASVATTPPLRRGRRRNV
jgi:hypothetical protein